MLSHLNAKVFAVAVLMCGIAVDSRAQSGAAGEWGKKAPLLEAVSEQAVAELNGKIYVIAGNTNDGGTVASVQVYDMATDIWKRTAPLPVAVNHNMAAAVNGKL